MGACAVGDNFAVGRLPAPLMCENPSQDDRDFVSESGTQFPLGQYSFLESTICLRHLTATSRSFDPEWDLERSENLIMPGTCLDVLYDLIKNSGVRETEIAVRIS